VLSAVYFNAMAARVTFEQAKALVTLHDTRSFEETAATLNARSATSVFHLIERMSAVIGRGPLAGPSTRKGVSLTTVGDEILPLARALVTAYEAFGQEHYEIRVSGYPALASLATKTVSRFDRERLDLDVVFWDISDQSRADRGESLVERAAAGEIDLVLAPAGYSLPQLEALKLYAWKLRVVLPDEEPRRKLNSISLHQLNDLRFLVAPLGHTSRRLFDEAARRLNIHPRVAMELVDQPVMAAIARDSTRYAAIIPDDAFGAPDKNLGPAFRDADGRVVGGRYAVYYSRRNVTDAAEGSHRATAVLALAKELERDLRRL
jgi:DNA-binding transcriptional LysR family regulator